MSVTRCLRCPNTLVAISMIISGERRTMRSCSRCGYRAWFGGEPAATQEKLALAGVLDEIRDERRANASRR